MPLERHEERAGQDEPRGRQRQVQSPAPPKRLAERAGDEAPVVEQRHQRRGDHDLLAAHSQRARRDRAGAPCARPPRARGADETIKRQQKKDPMSDSARCDEVCHRLRQQRVDRPEQRHAERDRRGDPFAEPPRDRGKFQRPAREAEERQRRQQVNRQVQLMVSADVHLAQRVVERKGQVHDRPRPGQNAPEQILLHADQVTETAVVEDERSVETVAVGEQSDADDRQAAERRPDEPPSRARARRLLG